MRLSRRVLVSAVLFAGCFDEGGNESRDKAVETLVQGMIAFGDIHSNIETDPAKSGEALLEFIKWPVAADSLVSPPFAGASDVMDTSPRLAPTSPVPACLTQSGEPACDSYTTNDTCEAGGFTFRGNMTRRCWDCTNPRDVCSYAWQLPELAFTSAKFNIRMSTAGTWTGMASQITPNLSARYDLEVPSGEGGEFTKRGGNLTACACTVFNIVDSPTTSGKPRKLVNSSFVVRAKVESRAERCALVLFDGNGNVTIEDSCACKGSDNVCVGPDPLIFADNTTCGNSKCDTGENFENCPIDCQYIPAVCMNDKCEIGEDYITCPEDCSLL